MFLALVGPYCDQFEIQIVATDIGWTCGAAHQSGDFGKGLIAPPKSQIDPVSATAAMTTLHTEPVPTFVKRRADSLWRIVCAVHPLRSRFSPIIFHEQKENKSPWSHDQQSDLVGTWDMRDCDRKLQISRSAGLAITGISLFFTPRALRRRVSAAD